ncbi:ABC transporter ATP-binding protein [Candidatus Peregrinibacteria bacterium]|nr:ABC transporter ATP-binding protein [Candidatus Peregrinibacteria bacterium]
MSLLKVQNLGKEYDSDGIKTPVLFDMNFSIEEGEFVAIMGPSGSGKSTLLHILGFLDAHTSGVYMFNEKSFQDYSEEEIALIRNREMGFVFQAFNLLPRTTVYDNVLLPLLYSDRPQKEWDALIKNAVAAVGLEHRTHFETSKLSGGERQRVAIARALVNNPRVIFADEPTGNLDSISGGAIMKIFQDLNEKEGHTIVLITHETTTAEFARRTLHILDGRIHSDQKNLYYKDAHRGYSK